MAEEEEFEFPIETDPELLLQEWVQEVQDYFPNFDPSPTSLAYRAASALCNMIGVGMDVAASVPPAIFRSMGQSLFEINPNDPMRATADTTWTAVNNAGYAPIPTGTIVSISGVLFETTQEVTFPSGTTVVTPIGIVALDEGTDANAKGGPGVAMVLEEAYDHIASVTMVGASIGGIDGETLEDYTIRLRETLRVLYPFVAVRGGDLEIIARTIPAIYRALSLDNYDLPTATSNVEGVATVILQGQDGEPVPQPVKDQYRDLIFPDDRRLVNHTLYITDPTYTTVNVNFSFTVYPGAEATVVADDAEAALAAFFNPVDWGKGVASGGPIGPDVWFNKPIISVYDIAGVLDQVVGLDRVTDITIGLGAATPTAGDKTMTGIGPLPRAGTMNGTAV